MSYSLGTSSMKPKDSNAASQRRADRRSRRGGNMPESNQSSHPRRNLCRERAPLRITRQPYQWISRDRKLWPFQALTETHWTLRTPVRTKRWRGGRPHSPAAEWRLRRPGSSWKLRRKVRRLGRFVGSFFSLLPRLHDRSRLFGDRATAAWGRETGT